MSTKQVNYSGFASIRNFMVQSQDVPTVTHDMEQTIIKAKNYGYTKTKVISVNADEIDWSKY